MFVCVYGGRNVEGGGNEKIMLPTLSLRYTKKYSKTNK